MKTIAEQLAEASQLRKGKKIDEALTLYESLWQQNSAAFSEWDGWSYGYCLQKKQKYTEELDLCRFLFQRYQQFEMIQQLYAWSVYYTQLAGENQPTNKDLFIKAVNAIVKLSPPGNAYSPAVKSIFKLVKFLSTGNPNNWDEIATYLGKLDKNKLSKETYFMDAPGRKGKELGSELEEWYSWQSKLLLQTKQWQKGLDLCNEALEKLDKWHYSNEIWFARRKAACLAELGQKSQAREIVNQLIKRKRDWFILADLAQLTENSDESIKLYAEAALAYGDLPLKIRLFYKMAELLAAGGDKKMAHTHALLVVALRVENKWAIPSELQQMLSDYGEVLVKIPSSILVATGLKPYWQTLAAKDENKTDGMPIERCIGKIYNLINDGMAGFIKPEIGINNIYFTFRNFEGNKEELVPGFSVSYEVNKSFDTKKNRDSNVAMRIRKNYKRDEVLEKLKV